MIKVFEDKLENSKDGLIIDICDKDAKVKLVYGDVPAGLTRTIKTYKADYNKLKGKVDLEKRNDQHIAYIFAINNGRLDYEALREGLKMAIGFARQEELTMGMRYKLQNRYGAWNDTLDVLNQAFKGYILNLYK